MGILAPAAPSGILAKRPAGALATPGLMEQAYAMYPRLKSYQFNYKNSIGSPDANGRMSETYPADESWNPMPGKPTIEQFNPNMTPKDLLGETMHILPHVDPKIGDMRTQFINSMTDQQKQMLLEQYQHSKDNYGEDRSFEDWRDRSGHDAWFRGHITGQWPSDIYTPEQIQMFGNLENYLKGND